MDEPAVRPLAKLLVCTAFFALSYNAEAQEPLISLGRQLAAVIPGTNGSPEFISITDAGLDDAGTVYALDGRQHLLGVFSRSGKWLTGIGPQGINEVSSGSVTGDRLTVASDTAVLVLNRQPGNIERYRLGTFGITKTGSFGLKSASGDLCVSGNEILFIGSYDSRVASRYTLSGKFLGSFGEPFSQNEGFSLVTSVVGGIIACNPQAGDVAIASRMHPTVRIYSSSGLLLRVYEIPNYRGVETTLRRDGGYQLALKAPVDVVEGVLSVGSFFVIQVSRGSSRRSNGTFGVESIILDAYTGKEIGRQLDLPLIHSIRNRSALVISNEPQPVARVFDVLLRRPKR